MVIQRKTIVMAGERGEVGVGNKMTVVHPLHKLHSNPEMALQTSRQVPVQIV
jgi:hypothetical protein